MIRIPTVLVLGAGASAEHGFPCGIQFRNRVCQLADDEEFLRLMDARLDRDRALDFLERLVHSEIGSPDRFLELYPDYIEIGKIAIAYVLGNCESDEQVFNTTRQNPPWYEVLIGALEFDAEDYGENDLTILTFNYDRSLEYYLWRVIEARYRHNESKVLQLWNNRPNIIHLHGNLGEFDPFDDLTRQYIPINGDYDPSYQLGIAAEGVEIIHEVNAATAKFDEAEEALRRARRIYFLGFAFDNRNVNRLRVFEDKLDGVEILGTGVGLSNSDQGRIVTDIFKGHVSGRAFVDRDIRELLIREELDKKPT